MQGEDLEVDTLEPGVRLGFTAGRGQFPGRRKQGWPPGPRRGEGSLAPHQLLLQSELQSGQRALGGMSTVNAVGTISSAALFTPVSTNHDFLHY